MIAYTVITKGAEWRELAQEAARRVKRYCAGVSGVVVVECQRAELLHASKIDICRAAEGPAMFFDADLWFNSDCKPQDVLVPGLVSAAHAWIPVGASCALDWAKTYHVDPGLWVNSGLMIFDADTTRDVFDLAQTLREQANENRDEIFINRALALLGYRTRVLPSAWNTFAGAGLPAHGYSYKPLAWHAAGVHGQKFERLRDACK